MLPNQQRESTEGNKEYWLIMTNNHNMQRVTDTYQESTLLLFYVAKLQ